MDLNAVYASKTIFLTLQTKVLAVRLVFHNNFLISTVVTIAVATSVIAMHATSQGQMLFAKHVIILSRLMQIIFHALIVN